MRNNQPLSPDILAHYGVLGMKWGVRKDKKPQGFQYGKAGKKWRARKKKATKVSADYAKTASLRKRNPKELSNEELRLVSERLQLESQYTQLTQRSKPVSKGKKISADIAKKFGNRIVDAAINETVKYGIKSSRELWKNR